MTASNPTTAQSAAPTTVDALVCALFDCEAIKLGGPFTLKSGLQSPIYVDLRLIVSFPHLLQSVASQMHQITQQANLKYDLLCGVPYTALPIASIISLQHNIPMVMRRKEVKEYGLKKAIEGKFSQGQNCLIIEDLVTSGLSCQETVVPLQQCGLEVTDIIVLIDRQQGGEANLKEAKLKLHSVVTLTQILDILLRANKINDSIAQRVRQFMADNQITMAKAQSATPAVSSTTAATIIPALPFADRSQLARNAVAKQLLDICAQKQTNLCLSADVTTSAELLQLARVCGPHICCLKTHIDCISDFTPALTAELQQLATQHQFILFEDRKFADIGSTVSSQYAGGLYNIASWSHLTNCHLLPGPAIITGLQQCAQQVAGSPARGLLLIAEMSSAGALTTPDYTAANVRIARQNSEFVCGFISQHRLIDDDAGFIHMTPGVQLAQGGDGLGQQYNTPHKVVAQQGCDIIIVGRGITQCKSQEEMAATTLQYKEAGWQAYQLRTKQ